MRYLIGVFLVATASFGQSVGAISGVVRDPFGGMQTDATVQAKNVQTGTVSKGVSKAGGMLTC